jgi:hypothetical protein
MRGFFGDVEPCLPFWQLQFDFSMVMLSLPSKTSSRSFFSSLHRPFSRQSLIMSPFCCVSERRRRSRSHCGLTLPMWRQLFPVKLAVVARDWKTPQEVREAIKSLHREKGISGVILVGAMPMHRFFMHEHANPNPVYFEDFDLRFVDKNKDGVDDAYEGKPQLKIWVANIRASEKEQDDDLPGLRRFFAKTHDYYTGKTVPELRTLFFSTDVSTEDWTGPGDWFKRRGGTRFSAPGDVTLLTGKACTHQAALEAFKKHSYSLTCVGVHSDETGHALADEDLMAHEIADLKPDRSSRSTMVASPRTGTRPNTMTTGRIAD